MSSKNTAKNTTSEIYSSIEKKREIEKQLQALSQEASLIAGQIPAVRTELYEARNRVMSLTETVKNEFSKNRETSNRGHLADAELRAKRIVNNLQKLERRAEEIQLERATLRNKLDDLTPKADMDTILLHKKSLDTARKEVGMLTLLIEEKERELGAISPDDDCAIEALQQRREDALAAAVTGLGTYDEVDVIDVEIGALVGDANGAEAERLKRYREISQTIAGLKRKLTAAKETLQYIDSNSLEVASGFLRTEAELVGTMYVEQATALIESFCRLRVLNTLITEMSSGMTAISKKAFPDLYLPSFALDALARATQHDASVGVFYSAKHAISAGEFDDFKAKEMNRLKEIGISEFLK